MFDIFVQFWWQFCLVVLASYAIGNINFAVFFSRVIQKKDVRTCGSGNPGTTNMFRVFGLRMGALTFVCDCMKGVVCCLVARFALVSLGDAASMQAQYLAGLFAVLGHVFPAVYRFRGGKGVATAMGVMFCTQPILMLCCIAPIVLVILISDRMSVMSLLFAAFMIVWTWTMLYPSIDVFCCVAVTVIFVVVIFAHRHNIVRIFSGNEKRLGVRKALRGKSEHRLRQLVERKARKIAKSNQNNDNQNNEDDSGTE